MLRPVSAWLSVIADLIAVLFPVLKVADKVGNPVRRFVRSPSKDRYSAVWPTLPAAPGIPETVTTVEDGRAIRAIDESLSRIGLNASDVIAGDVDDALASGNLILVGGPKTNKQTAKLLQQSGVTLPLRFAFTDDVWTIVDRNGVVAHGAGVPGRMDHGLVARLKNPRTPAGSPDSIIILVAGVNGLGTRGAAELAFKACRRLDERLRKLDPRGVASNFVALVDVHANGGQSVSVEIARIETL